MITNTNARSYVESLPQQDPKDLSEVTGSADADCIDLLEKMLNLNPEERITVEDAIKHPYLESLHDPEDEPTFDKEIDFSFENDSTMTLEAIQKKILEEISCYNPAYADLII